MIKKLRRIRKTETTGSGSLLLILGVLILSSTVGAVVAAADSGIPRYFCELTRYVPVPGGRAPDGTIRKLYTLDQGIDLIKMDSIEAFALVFQDSLSLYIRNPQEPNQFFAPMAETAADSLVNKLSTVLHLHDVSYGMACSRQ